jgi:hypothetical protein
LADVAAIEAAELPALEQAFVAAIETTERAAFWLADVAAIEAAELPADKTT